MSNEFGIINGKNDSSIHIKREERERREIEI
jgi:hypothetical protein